MTQFLGSEGFQWWVGIAEDVKGDPKQLGRIKVRIIGEHDDLEAQFLPWCTILMSPTSASQSGKGMSPVGIMENSYVIGFYIDGADKQFPMVIGTFHGMQDLDPNKSDMNLLARGINKLTNRKFTGPEPAPSYKAKYPMNQVFESRSGHVIEIDDSEGDERIHIYHRKGTYIEINKNGRVVIKSVDSSIDVTDKEKQIYAKGDIKITSEENISIQSSKGIKMAAPGGVTITEGSLVVRGSISSTVGVTGCFTTPTGKTVHIQSGFVSNIT